MTSTSLTDPARGCAPSGPATTCSASALGPGGHAGRPLLLQVQGSAPLCLGPALAPGLATATGACFSLQDSWALLAVRASCWLGRPEIINKGLPALNLRPTRPASWTRCPAWAEWLCSQPLLMPRQPSSLCFYRTPPTLLFPDTHLRRTRGGARDRLERPLGVACSPSTCQSHPSSQHPADPTKALEVLLHRTYFRKSRS